MASRYAVRVFGNLQMRRCAVEEDAFASGLNHVLYGGKRAGIVVHNHPFRFSSVQMRS